MYISVAFYRAREGEEDAIVALHEDWERHLRDRATGYVSGELLANPSDLREFVDVMRFASRDDCRRMLADPEHDAWHARLLSLIDGTPRTIECVSWWEAWNAVSACLERSACSRVPATEEVHSELLA